MSQQRLELDVLFLGNYAERTGAPTSLLRLLKWFHESSPLSAGVLLGTGGALLDDYEAEAPVWVWHGVHERPVSSIIARPPAKQIVRAMRRRRLNRIIKTAAPRILFGNTSAVFRMLAECRLQLPAVSFVREMDHVIEHEIGREMFRWGAQRCERLIGVSHAVRRGMVEHQGVPPESAIVIPGCLPVDVTQPDAEAQRAKLLEVSGCSDRDARIVVGVGTIGHGKGTDLFVELADKLNSSPHAVPTNFIWLGRADALVDPLPELKQLAGTLGVADRVFFPGAQPDATQLMAGADMLALTSRSDSFPLVVMEAALAGTPTACFADAGGAPELVEEDAGIVAPYLDVDAMAMQLAKALPHPATLGSWAETARRKVVDRHDVNVIGKQVVDVIEQFGLPRSP